jgi:tRNA-dihydrouridine synthase B
MMRTYFSMLVEEMDGDAKGFHSVLGKMKQFASWFTHGLPGGANLRKSVYAAKNETEVMGIVDDFFAVSREAALPQPTLG